MDPNDVIDVPDTPDRVSFRHRSVGNASHVSVARELGGSDSTIEGMQNRMASRNLVVSQNRQNGRLHNLQSRDTGTSGRITTGRDIVVPVSKNSASENGSLFRKVACEPFRPDKRLHASSEKMDDRKNVHLKYTSEPSDRLGHPICPHREQSMHHRVLHEPSSHSAEKDCRSAKFRMGPPLVIGSSLSSNRHPSRGINDSNKGKEKVNDHVPNCNGIGAAKYSISFNDGNSRQKDPVNVPAPMPSSRANGRKRLVRNGCISAHNIAMTMQLDKTTGNSVRDEISTSTNSKAPAGASHAIAINGGINRSSSSQLKCKGVDSHPCSSREHGAKSQDFSTGGNVAKRQKKLVTPSHQGNSGNAVCVGSRGESSSSSKTCDGSRVVNAVIEVESSPEVRQVNRESPHELEARARQLEVDEMLARELQEQLYDELPYNGMSEQIDSELAWRLQQEEAVAHAPLNRNDRVNPSGRSFQARRQVRSQLSRNQPRRGRTRAGDTTSRLARLRNQIHNRTNGGLFPSHMDLDTRIELLEALEAVVDDDIRSVTQLLDSDREFTETDYELLLRLDENNHEHLGASSRQITNLPESTVQTENYDACSICLETPAVGDAIRHLPCLHKFHKDCIDQWLRRKKSCPVCKFDIA